MTHIVGQGETKRGGTAEKAGMKNQEHKQFFFFFVKNCRNLRVYDMRAFTNFVT